DDAQYRYYICLYGLCLFDILCYCCIHVHSIFALFLFFFKQKTAYELGLGIPAEPLFRSFRWIHLSTPLIRLFLLVLILLLMPTLNFLPVWFALSLLRFRLPSRLPMMFILWMVAMMVVIIPSRTV